MAGFLIVNPHSGSGNDADELLREAKVRKIAVHSLEERDDVAELARGADADALGIAGGDGSLATVAEVALERGLPFVCIPFGTRNHFARDIGLDRDDPVGALDALVHREERVIDVGRANGRLFLNNVSLGIYGDAVQQPGYRGAKARTLLETAAHVLGPSAHAPGLVVVDDEGRSHVDPAVVLVSNNPYSLEPPHAPVMRPRLDSGQLGIIVLDTPRGGPGPGRSWTAARLELTAPASLHAGLDGEAVDLNSPLELVSRPGALRVRVLSTHR